jgi:hypothetical protein
MSNKNLNIVGYFDDKYTDFKMMNGLYYGPVSYAHRLINNFEDIRL